MWSEAWTPASGEDGKPHGFHADMLAVKSALCNRAMTFISHSKAKNGKRGKVLRAPHAGPGILIVEGRQYQFWLDGSWNSDVPPKRGLPVDIMFSAQGQIQEITVVSEALLERAHAERAKVARKTSYTAFFEALGQNALPLAAGLALPLSWMSLAAVSVTSPVSGRVDLTFWCILSLLNARGSSDLKQLCESSPAGTYGLLAVLCVIATLIGRLWRRKAVNFFGGLAPLTFFVWVSVTTRKHLLNGAETTISLEWGAYVSSLLSVYLASVAIRKLFTRRAATPAANGATEVAA
jgi:hypothetical protein